MTLKVVQDHRNCFYLICRILLPISSNSNDLCLPSFPIYYLFYSVRDCLCFDTAVESRSHMYASRFLCKHTVLNTFYRPSSPEMELRKASKFKQKKWSSMSLKVISIGAVQQAVYDFLLVFIVTIPCLEKGHRHIFASNFAKSDRYSKFSNQQT